MAQRGGFSQDFFQIDATSLSAFNRRVRDLDKKAAKELGKTVRELAKPVVNDVRGAALRLPSKGEDLSNDSRWNQKDFRVGLRQGIAQATEFKMFYRKSEANARIRVSGTKFAAATGKYRKLPRYVEGMNRKPWRHPVFADKGATNGKWEGAWTEQKPSPFMLKTVLAHKDKVRREIVQAFIDAVDAQLELGRKI